MLFKRFLIWSSGGPPGGEEPLTQGLRKRASWGTFILVNKIWTSGLKKVHRRTADKERSQGELKIEEFKGFSRPLNDFSVLFKAYLISMDFFKKAL